jgi:ribosome maturation factor RimP
MATGERIDAVVAAAAPVLDRLGLAVYDVQLAGGRTPTLRVLVERDTGDGVDLDAITSATRALSSALDADPALSTLLPGPYTLEVSSPGLERPLRTPAHFRRAVGSQVSIKARTASGGARRRGVVVEADDQGVDVDFGGAHERVPYDDIVQARTIFEWGAPPRDKRPRRKKQEVAR